MQRVLGIKTHTSVNLSQSNVNDPSIAATHNICRPVHTGDRLPFSIKQQYDFQSIINNLAHDGPVLKLIQPLLIYH